MTQPRAEPARTSAPDGLGALAPLLACPSCKREGGGLAARADHFLCLNCKTEFPVLRSGGVRIPWLDRAPEAARLEWRARFNEFLNANAAERRRLERALAEVRRSKPAIARISALLSAREAQRKEIVDLLAPLALGSMRAAPTLDRSGVLHDRLPQRDALVDEHDSLLRDWAWESVENDSRFECVREVLPERKAFKAGKLLTLGAGACRLAYDLHRALRTRAVRRSRRESVAAAARGPRAEPRDDHAARISGRAVEPVDGRNRAPVHRAGAARRRRRSFRARPCGCVACAVQGRQLRHRAHALAARHRAAELDGLGAHGEPAPSEGRDLDQHGAARVPASQRGMVLRGGGGARARRRRTAS